MDRGDTERTRTGNMTLLNMMFLQVMLRGVSDESTKMQELTDFLASPLPPVQLLYLAPYSELFCEAFSAIGGIE